MNPRHESKGNAQQRESKTHNFNIKRQIEEKFKIHHFANPLTLIYNN